MKKLLLVLCFWPSLLWATTPYQTAVNALAPCVYYYMDAPSGTTETNHGAATSQDGTYVNTPDLGIAGIPANTGANADAAVTFKSASSEKMTITGGGGGACAGTGTRNIGTLTCASGTARDATVIGWVKQASAHSGSLFGNGDADLNPSQFFFAVNSTGTIQAKLFQDGGAAYIDSGVSSATPCTTGAWCMAAYKVTQATHKVQTYPNGTPDSSSTTESGSCGSADPPAVATLGTFGSLYIDGTVDEMAAFDSLVSDADILALYTLGSTVPANPAGLNNYSVKNEIRRLFPGMPDLTVQTYGNEHIPLPSGPYAPKPKFIQFRPVERGMYVQQ